MRYSDKERARRISAKARAMNEFNNDNIGRHEARKGSGRLGRLAAEQPTSRLGSSIEHLDSISPAAVPTRLTSILVHLRQRRQRQEHASDQLRAQEFLSGM